MIQPKSNVGNMKLEESASCSIMEKENLNISETEENQIKLQSKDILESNEAFEDEKICESLEFHCKRIAQACNTDYKMLITLIINKDIIGILALNLSSDDFDCLLNFCMQSLDGIVEQDYFILPLVNLKSEIENNVFVEKLYVNENTIEIISNKDFQKCFHRSPLLGTVIKFEQLNEVNCQFITVLGTLKNVFTYFKSKRLLSDVQLLKCYLKVNQFGNGIYMISNLFNKNEENKIAYLCLLSKLDNYYKDVHQKSRAIHFLRYMMLLSTNILFLPDNDDCDHIVFNDQSSKKENRIRSYKIKDEQVQTESCSVNFFGDFSLPETIKDCSVYTSSSQNLLIANFRMNQITYSEKTATDILSAKEIYEKYKGFGFKFPLNVDFLFKEEYFSIIEPEKVAKLKSKLLDDINNLNETEGYSNFKKKISLYISKEVIDSILDDEYRNLLTACIDLVKDESFQFELLKSFPDHTISRELKINLIEIIERSQCHNEILKLLEEHKVHTTSKIHSRYSMNTIMKAAKSFANSRVSKDPIAKSTLCRVKSNLNDFSENEILKNKLASTYINEMLLKYKDHEQNRIWEETINDEFQHIVNAEKISKTNYIKNVQEVGKNMYQIAVNVEEKNPETYAIQFHKFCPKDLEAELSHCTNLQENFISIQQNYLKFYATENVVNVFPCASNYVMILKNINEINETSKLLIMDIVKLKKILEVPFPKPIALCDFDNISRIIAIYSNANDCNFIVVYKFKSDFSTYDQINQIELEKFNICNVISFQLQYSSKYVWLVSESGEILRLDYKNGLLSMKKQIDSTKNNYISIKMDPSGKCLFLFTEDNICYPLMVDTFNMLHQVQLASNCKLAQIGNYSMAIEPHCEENYIRIFKLNMKTAKSELQISKMNYKQEENASKKFFWLHYLYWMFLKFPCDDPMVLHSQKQFKYYFLINCARVNDELKKNVMKYMKTIENKLHSTNKPLFSLGTWNIGIKTYSEFQFPEDSEQLLGNFIKQLICLVPCQIAGCQFGEFYVFNNGTNLDITKGSKALDLKNHITLGLIESIFNSWQKNIKVISSMGKQSTGKSYTLNHLTGSSYDISGTRCTVGCWLSLKISEDCLYVVLDFEGLGSFERNDQDDMLLSVFNSAISNMTLYKSEYRLDKDVNKMFARFNLGSNKLKDDKQLFRGCFYIIIKDVSEQDFDDIYQEFEEKIETIIIAERENFIATMYNGRYCIFPFSLFQTSDYFEDMEQLQKKMYEITPTFDNGIEFLEFLKLLLAKLAIGDFKEIGLQQIEARVNYLKEFMQYAIIFGQTSSAIPKNEHFDLHCLDNSINVIEKFKTINLEQLSEPIILNDFKYIFKDEYLSNIISDFSDIYTQNGTNFTKWRLGLEDYISNILQFRIERVQKWIDINFAKYQSRNSSEYDDNYSELTSYFETVKNESLLTFKICNEECHLCYLKCTQIISHHSPHQCNTDHACNVLCDFCDPNLGSTCSLSMGHEEKHICKDVPHICGEPCRYNTINYCDHSCQQKYNHKGDHICSNQVHICRLKCSLQDCLGTCQINCEIMHNIHKCSKEQCVQKCCIKNCHNLCTTLDHFHLTEISKQYREQNCDENEDNYQSEHFCGNKHKCEEKCSKEGYCKTYVEKSIESQEDFFGKVDKFQYKRRFVQKGEKLNCHRMLNPYEKEHSGAHICSSNENKMHSCKEVCPTCENICDKAFGHTNEGDTSHDTSHGNMLHSTFIANADEVSIGKHKYKVGESAIAEMCDMFCNSLGRGHIHILECDKEPDNCIYDQNTDSRTHAKCKYEPNPNTEKDEVTHSKYWETIGWKDPCTAADIINFHLCPCYCSSEEHGEDKSFCMGNLWHKPFENVNDAQQKKGTLTNDGHVFACEHPPKIFHFVLALDASTSMEDKWDNLVNSVIAFVNSRSISSIWKKLFDTFKRIVKYGEKSKNADKLSIIIYSSSSNIAAEYIDMSCFNPRILKYKGGATSFAVALKAVDKVIFDHRSKSVIPILIFMSDGECNDGNNEMKSIFSNYRNDYNFESFFVGFGGGDFERLEELAKLSNGTLVKCAKDLDLKNAFVRIAASFPAKVSVNAII